MGLTNKPYVVTLHPKEYCSCPANSLCYHIIAVWLSVGMQLMQQIYLVNLVEVLVRRVYSSSFYCSLGATKRMQVLFGQAQGWRSWST